MLKIDSFQRYQLLKTYAFCALKIRQPLRGKLSAEKSFRIPLYIEGICSVKMCQQFLIYSFLISKQYLYFLYNHVIQNKYTRVEVL